MSLQINNELINKSKISDKDTGSVQVQVASLTEKIHFMKKHADENPKDNSAKRGLLKLVANRRKFLGYLKRKDQEEYRRLVDLLGLRK